MPSSFRKRHPSKTKGLLLNTSTTLYNLTSQRNTTLHCQNFICKRNSSICSINMQNKLDTNLKFVSNIQKSRASQSVHKNVNQKKQPFSKQKIGKHPQSSYELSHWKRETSKKNSKHKQNGKRKSEIKARCLQSLVSSSKKIQKLNKLSNSMCFSTVAGKFEDSQFNAQSTSYQPDSLTSIMTKTSQILNQYQKMCFTLEKQKDKYRIKYLQASRKLKICSKAK